LIISQTSPSPYASIPFYLLILTVLSIAVTYNLSKRTAKRKTNDLTNKRSPYNNRRWKKQIINQSKQRLSKSNRKQKFQQQILHNIPSYKLQPEISHNNNQKLRMLIQLLQYCCRFQHLNPYQLYREHLLKHNNGSLNQLNKSVISNQSLGIMRVPYLFMCKLIKKFYLAINFLITFKNLTTFKFFDLHNGATTCPSQLNPFKKDWFICSEPTTPSNPATKHAAVLNHPPNYARKQNSRTTKRSDQLPTSITAIATSDPELKSNIFSTNPVSVATYFSGGITSLSPPNLSTEDRLNYPAVATPSYPMIKHAAAPKESLNFSKKQKSLTKQIADQIPAITTAAATSASQSSSSTRSISQPSFEVHPAQADVTPPTTLKACICTPSPSLADLTHDNESSVNTKETVHQSLTPNTLRSYTAFKWTMDIIHDAFNDFCYPQDLYGPQMRSLRHIGRVLSGTYYMIPPTSLSNRPKETPHQHDFLDQDNGSPTPPSSGPPTFSAHSYVAPQYTVDHRWTWR
jgi:hypothetical protein